MFRHCEIPKGSTGNHDRMVASVISQKVHAWVPATLHLAFQEGCTHLLSGPVASPRASPVINHWSLTPGHLITSPLGPGCHQQLIKNPAKMSYNPLKQGKLGASSLTEH